MTGKDIAIVFDCGATNVRVIAINGKGRILASESYRNSTGPDPFHPDGRIWDVSGIWNKLCTACRNVTGQIDKGTVAGVTVTAFGVDGTFFNSYGKMLYPVISWQCERTVPVMSGIGKYISVRELYDTTGVQPFNFNTINKFIWLRENKPEVVEKSDIFLFIPSIFSYYLTGEMVNDMSMAGTSMMTDIESRAFSDHILDRIGFPPAILGKPAEPGTVTGRVTMEAASLTGLPEGVPVVATGHDTQFAIFGSGAGVNQPVLSSGTWEILMVRSPAYRTGMEQLEMGITTELDSRPGLYDIGNQWIASGMLEWARKTFYSDIPEDGYETMINGASKVPAGSNGVTVIPKFYEEMKGKPGGEIRGLTMNTTREEIYRAMIEALCLRLRNGKKALEKAGGFMTESIICVGGGSKNRLWNQMRADFTGVPVKVTENPETTVLGASLFVQYATGNASSPEDARSAIKYKTETFYPRMI